MIEKNKNSIVVIVLLATLFGLLAGIVGSLTVRSYFGTSSAFWGELNFVNGNLDRPNVVISGAKKVVVVQDEKISETISQVSPSLVSIYRKKATSTEKNGIDLDTFYSASGSLGTGLIVTSDGWIVTDALNHLDFTEKNREENIEKYIIIDSNREIYNIDSVEVDLATDYVFLHIDARDLPVISISKQNNLNRGETVLGLNPLGDIYVSTISSVRDAGAYLSISSDFYYDEIALVDEFADSFYSSFIFDISGRIIIFANKEGDLIPSRVFSVAIESLFEEGAVARPSLGLNYSDLSYFVSSDAGIKNHQISGALVNPSPKSSIPPWFEAGIEVGDIIKYVDGVELDDYNSLAKIVMNYSPGDEIEFGLLRGSEEMEISVELLSLE